MNFHKIAVFAAVLLSAMGAHAAGEAAKATAVATTVCVACHSADGNSLLPVNPNLAGQHPEYLTKQLKDFKAGTRANPVMGAMVGMLSEDDMANLGAYFASQALKGGAAKSNGPGSEGEKIYKGGVASKGVPACAACHGPSGAGIPAQYPRLGGQHTDYVVVQLKAFRAGERGNAPMMKTIAATMSDQEIAAVADYVQGLK